MVILVYLFVRDFVSGKFVMVKNSRITLTVVKSYAILGLVS